MRATLLYSHIKWRTCAILAAGVLALELEPVPSLALGHQFVPYASAEATIQTTELLHFHNYWIIIPSISKLQR